MIVLDSLGIGNARDAERFSDSGANTFSHIAERVPGMRIPNLSRLGIGNLTSLRGISPAAQPLSYYCRLNEASNGKDTMTGHWEMMGIRTDKPFITFTETGFPKELVEELEKRCGRR